MKPNNTIELQIFLLWKKTNLIAIYWISGAIALFANQIYNYVTIAFIWKMVLIKQEPPNFVQPIAMPISFQHPPFPPSPLSPPSPLLALKNNGVLLVYLYTK